MYENNDRLNIFFSDIRVACYSGIIKIFQRKMSSLCLPENSKINFRII